jgi:hypothetical protein
MDVLADVFLDSWVQVPLPALHSSRFHKGQILGTRDSIMVSITALVAQLVIPRSIAQDLILDAILGNIVVKTDFALCVAK